MKVSVLIPVYNVEKYIEKCIISIINQTMTNDVECIILNDYTPDKSIEIVNDILSSYNGNISFRIINHEQNKGLAVARNSLITAATGDYIIHIDSDDYCEPDMIEKMYQKAIEKDADIVVADYYKTEYKKEIYQHAIVSADPDINIKLYFRGYAATYVWNKLVKRSLYTTHHLKNPEGLNNFEDAYMCICWFLFAQKVSYCPFAFVHHIVFNVNSYTNCKNFKSLKDQIGICNEIEHVLKRNGKYKQFEQCFQIYLAGLQFNLLKNSHGNLQRKWNKDYKIAIRYILKHNGLNSWQKTALAFASCNMLWIFNLLRYLKRLQNQILRNN